MAHLVAKMFFPFPQLTGALPRSGLQDSDPFGSNVFQPALLRRLLLNFSPAAQRNFGAVQLGSWAETCLKYGSFLRWGHPNSWMADHGKAYYNG